MDKTPSPDPPTRGWVSIRRRPTAMTTVSGGNAGGGWEYVESPSPSPQKKKRHTFRPERWGSLRRDRVESYDSEPNRPAVESPSSNPLPMRALSASSRATEMAHIHNIVCPRRVGGELDAGKGSTTDRSDVGDGLTQAWVEAQRDVKMQMRKMGLHVSSSSDED